MKTRAKPLLLVMDSSVADRVRRFDFGGLNLSRFMERPPWHGGDLQTIRNFLTRKIVDLSRFGAQRLELPLGDGSGDRLVAHWHHPPEVRAPKRPLVILIHGLTGCDDSVYLRATAAHLLLADFPVLRLNLRGAGPARPLCRFHYHAGRTEDLANALAALPAVATERGVLAVGYSLGGNLLLKYLGECGERTPVTAAVAVSAPLDLMATARRLMLRRNAIYHWYFVNELRRECLGQGAELTPAERRTVITAQSLWEFDDRFTAPRNGFAGAADYYTRCSSRLFLDRIAVPTLLIHAEDDPIVPSEPYRFYDWGRNPKLAPVLERKGGHVGFHDRSGGTWHDGVIRCFFERVLSLS